MKYKNYCIKRYLFFWLSIAVYFIPYIIVAACLLPFVKTGEGAKWGIGLGIAAINAVPFLGGIFRGFRAHFPFVNLIAFLFLFLAAFFMTDLFQNYVYSFLWIELAAMLGSVGACILWHYHRKYKGINETYRANKKIGMIQKEK